MKLASVHQVKVPIQVVLGVTSWSLGQMMEIGEGTIIELDRLAGEPVDVVAAGELIAKGEVVVIDENFGVRITKVVEEPKEIGQEPREI
jgi:flagellar motor switch protein FliN/FliY